MIKAAIDGEIDAMLGFLSLQQIRAMFLSETRMYASIPLALIIPPGDEYGDLEKFTRPFSSTVWIIVIVILFIACLVAFAAAKRPGTVSNFLVGKNVKTPLYNVFAVFNGVSQNVLPKRNFARFILMCFVIYSLVIRSVYQGAVYQILKSNDRKPPISTIRELIDQKFSFYLYATLAPRLTEFEFYKLRVVYPNIEIHEKRLLTLNPSFKGVVFNYLTQIIYHNQQNINNFTLTVCKEYFNTSPIVFYFRKNHYLVDEVNDHLDLLLMNGMVNFFSHKYADPRFLSFKKPSGERKVLNLTHFRGAFHLHLMLLAASVLVFCVEVVSKLR